MKMNDTQAAMLTIQLATLGQVDLSDNEVETLRTLEHLLEQALENVREALKVGQAQNRGLQ